MPDTVAEFFKLRVAIIPCKCRLNNPLGGISIRISNRRRFRARLSDHSRAYDSNQTDYCKLCDRSHCSFPLVHLASKVRTNERSLSTLVIA